MKKPETARQTQVEESFRHFLHDISSPLTVIQYHLDHASKELSEDQKQYLGKVLESASHGVNHLSRMVISTKKLLDKGQSQGMFSAVAELQTVQTMYEPFTLGRGVRIVSEFNDDKLIMGDAVLFGRIIANLIQNALEAIEGESAGVILLRTKRTKDYFQIEVTDDGPGVSPEIQNKLFIRGISTKGYDRGSGLALVKDLLQERFNARITYVARKRGSCFLIRFPAVK